MAGQLPYGPRDELITVAVAAALDEVRTVGPTVDSRDLDDAEAAVYLANHLRDVVPAPPRCRAAAAR